MTENFIMRSETFYAINPKAQDVEYLKPSLSPVTWSGRRRGVAVSR